MVTKQTKFTHWALDYVDRDLFPHSNEGNEIYGFLHSDGKYRITIWCDLSDEPGCYPALTLEQAVMLHKQLGHAIKEVKDAGGSLWE